MATTYASWQDVWELLDQDAYPAPDTEKLTEELEKAELDLSRKLRRFFTLPFVEATQPDSFALAKEIVCRWAAAEFMEFSRQAEGSESLLWRVKRLRERADELMVEMMKLREPDDATDSADPVVHTPSDGLTSDDRTAIFDRGQITPGDSSHW